VPPAVQNKSEVWLGRYAVEHGLTGGDDHQPDLGGGSDAPRPDFRLRRGQSSAIIEVKEFETSTLHRRLAEAGPRNMVSLDSKTEYGTMRNKLGEAAKNQLRFYANRGEALIACLANPNSISVPMNHPQEILEAMNGDLGFAIPIDTNTGGPAGEGGMFFGRNGAFVDSHRYVSAVMTLHRGTHSAEAIERWHENNRPRWEGIEDRRERGEAVAQAALEDEELRVAEAIEGDFYFVRVFESRWVALGDAVPVPRDLFVGPRDEFWAIDPETGAVALIEPSAG
jgi:hypothetical protein